MSSKYYSIIYILLLNISVVCNAKTILNPISYGILDAKSGIEKYECLLKCHQDAVRNGCAISYAGVVSLDIEIPDNAKSIPLPAIVDFSGVELNVLNNTKHFTLFTKSASATPIDVSPSMIDNGLFKGIVELETKKTVLCIEDQNPWVENRKGYSYGANRKDMLVLSNGKAQNCVVSGYNNSFSSPKVSYFVAGEKTVFKNLTFNRDENSSFETYLVYIKNHYNVLINNIVINTPQENDLFGDRAICIENSSKVRLKDIVINGTYSQKNKYGYGISMNNVSMFIGERIYARARWGVFGTNNVNGATLTDCDINRFDIHCYGQDLRCYDCKFSNLYNQFSSVFGVVLYDRCVFTDFTPVLMESSYNAYTPFDITFKKCTFNLSAKRNYLIALLGLEQAHNSRNELARKALPNITIRSCKMNFLDSTPDRINKWTIINTGKVLYEDTLDYISHITVNGLTVSQACEFDIFSTSLKTTEPLQVSMRNLYVVQNGKRKKCSIPHCTVDENRFNIGN